MERIGLAHLRTLDFDGLTAHLRTHEVLQELRTRLRNVLCACNAMRPAPPEAAQVDVRTYASAYVVALHPHLLFAPDTAETAALAGSAIALTGQFDRLVTERGISLEQLRAYSEHFPERLLEYQGHLRTWRRINDPLLIARVQRTLRAKLSSLLAAEPGSQAATGLQLQIERLRWHLSHLPDGEPALRAFDDESAAALAGRIRGGAGGY